MKNFLLTILYSFFYLSLVAQNCELDPGDLENGDHFGKAVAIDGVGDVVAVGAPDLDSISGNAGGTYLFKWTGSDWME